MQETKDRAVLTESLLQSYNKAICPPEGFHLIIESDWLISPLLQLYYRGPNFEKLSQAGVRVLDLEKGCLCGSYHLSLSFSQEAVQDVQGLIQNYLELLALYSEARKKGIEYFNAMPDAFTNADLNAMIVTCMVDEEKISHILSLERLAQEIHELVESGQTTWEELGFSASDVNDRLHGKNVRVITLGRH